MHFDGRLGIFGAISRILSVVVIAFVLVCPAPGFAGQQDASRDTLRTWYRLILELVRHTPTYSPPVASRSFAYAGITAFEAVASGSAQLRSLAGQLNGLKELPRREAGEEYSDALVLHSAMASAVRNFFSNTGPTGQRAMNAVEAKLLEIASRGVSREVVDRSRAFGQSIAAHVIEWSASDGGAVVENMGFPLEYMPKAGKANWVPTSAIRQQQAPLLPGWGANRPFAMAQGNACPLPPPPPYSEDPASEFYKQAQEVAQVRKNLTQDQKIIARFWADDPMLSPTPPGHWISILWQVLEKEGADVERSAEALALLGVAVADSFIGCWHTKFEYDLLRPVTYIRRVIDPAFEPLMTTPPFPEYPSGHSTQSGAAAEVLTALFGENHAFTDATHEDDGIPARSYSSFREAAKEAGISRLYGGIHFRAAIERGLEQGRCIGAHAASLKTRN